MEDIKHATGTTTTNDQSAPFHLTDVDRAILAQSDDEFVPHSWEELKEIVAKNDLSVFRRKPSQLARYIEWSRKIKAEYGTVVNYVCQRRLHWEPQRQSGLEKDFPSSSSQQFTFTVQDPIPFTSPADYRILRNDWPYGVADDIVHLVVWLKTPIAVNPADGFLIPESRALIERFMDKTFVQRLKQEGGHGDAGDAVLWFKNWTALQSVGALEHVHVMVRGAD